MTETQTQDKANKGDKSDASATDAPTADFGQFGHFVTDYRKVADEMPKGTKEEKSARGAAFRAIRTKLAEAVKDAEARLFAAIDADDAEGMKAAGTDKRHLNAVLDAIGVKDLDADKAVDWAQRVANRVKTLRAAADALEGAKPGKYGIPDDADLSGLADKMDNASIDDKRLESILKVSLGPKGTKAKQHPTWLHIVEVVRNSDKWLTTAEIANTPSDAYEGGSAGNGAINAAFSRPNGKPDPKLAKYGVRVVKRANGGGEPIWGAEPMPGKFPVPGEADISDEGDDADVDDKSDDTDK